jgi:glycosyltransferase involved in cell wall biosynthesis
MHVVLTKTELPRLRGLGYEVYNPPYNSDVYDQSANLNWEREQPSTLPPDVFEELSRYNFFYNRITPRIAELLNEYFGTIIVTINPDWLTEILKVYKGRVIYRVYGQLGTLSEALQDRRIFRNIETRDNFWVVPHAEEAVRDEHDWLRHRMVVVPYTLPLDIFNHRDTWGTAGSMIPEVMASCPNIANPYYRAHYKHVRAHFPQPELRLYGVQPRSVTDPRVVGTIPRPTLLEKYKRSAGYIYTYEESSVCYLPPIEMMTVGGPVLYRDGSLLARYFGKNNPGVFRDPKEADRKLRRLLAQDQPFVHELIESQKPVRKIYDPDYVNPIFDREFSRLLNPTTQAPGRDVLVDPARAPSARSRVYVLFHFPGNIVQHSEGIYSSAEGIPRVVKKAVEALLEKTSHDIVVTAKAAQLPWVMGFFEHKAHPDRIRFQVVNPAGLAPRQERWVMRQYRATKKLIKRTAKFGYRQARLAFHRLKVHAYAPLPDRLKPFIKILLIPAKLALVATNKLSTQWPDLKEFLGKVARKLREKRAYLLSRIKDPLKRFIFYVRHYPAIQAINQDPGCACAIVPHYYHFPESIGLKRKTILYLPDFMPHLVPEGFSGWNEKLNTIIGRKLCRHVDAIFTNAQFTKSYLPETRLQVAPSKVEVLPLPLLIQNKGDVDDLQRTQLEAKFGKSPYLFYPTQNRPNKQIAFLLRVFAKVRVEFPDLKLVLTCRMSDYLPAQEAFETLRLKESVIFAQRSSDAALSWLYRNAHALCLTSTMEGNFPPQALEALTFGTPIVATRLPFFSEALGDDSQGLQLCEPLNEEDFAAKLRFVLRNQEQARAQQARAFTLIMEKCSDEKFSAAFNSFVGRAIKGDFSTSSLARVSASKTGLAEGTSK